MGWFSACRNESGNNYQRKINEKANKPAYIMEVDLGELGIKRSSAQITVNYTPEELVGRRVLCVCNFLLNALQV